MFAYEMWTPLLGEGNTSKLIAVRDEAPHAVLLSALPGIVMEKAKLTPDQERIAWQKAGSVLAHLHAITNGFFGRPRRDGSLQEAETSAVTFWKSRLENWIERGATEQILTGDEIAFARSMLSLVTIFDGETAVAVHGDYTPRNWMVDSLTGRWVGVFDFEHICWDVRAAEFKLHYDLFFRHRPDLEKAFFTGYGMQPDKKMHLQIQLVQTYQAISGTIWAAEHHDQAFETKNRSILHRLMKN